MCSMRSVLAALVSIALTAPLSAAQDARLRKPRLDLRATPRMAFSPTVVFLTAELAGGDDVEEFYCPEVVWEWDDGGRSERGSDCPPFGEGGEFQRRFTAEHAYRRAGVYTVRVRLMRSGKPVAAASATVNIRPGVGDFSSGQ
jgi:hypothetical protein